jgi:type IV secretory pathway VirB4 component
MDQLRSFAEECVSNYAKYDKSDNSYSLELEELPDFVKHEFASIIMSDDNAWASEATGPDNKNWEKKMLPALTRYLKNSTDRDEAIEFNNTWRDCVSSYMNDKMQELINDSLVVVFYR